MSARLADIARHAGVSEATVSRVLNDRPGVSEDKRRAVLVALDALGYERASRLREKSRRRVGLILPESLSAETLDLAEHVVANFARRGVIATMSLTGAGGVDNDELLDAFDDMGCSAVVGIDVALSSSSRTVARAVLAGAHARADLPSFVTRMDEKLRAAVRHAHALGHARVIVIGSPSTGDFRDTDLAGVDIVNTPAGRESGGLALSYWEQSDATAMVTSTAAQAVGVLEAARDRDVQVPAELSLVSLEDDPALALYDPAVSAISRPSREIAIAAVDAVVGDINGIPATAARFDFAPEVRSRESIARLK